jgi:hypothetical protein
MSYIAVVVRALNLKRLSEIAEDQWGLVTRRQAADLAGVPRATLDRLASPGGLLERVAHGVYRLMGAPVPDQLDLRAAWLQLAPDVPAWERTPIEGIVSHRSAASLYGVGDLPADRHEFTLPARHQSRRPDVRIHKGSPAEVGWINLRGLPVTRPSQIASDLLSDNEEPEAVARVVSESLHHIYDYPGSFAQALAPHAARLGLRKGDGVAVLRWLLDLAGDPDAKQWMEVARADSARPEPSSITVDPIYGRPPSIQT